MVPSEMWSRLPTSRFEIPLDTNSMIYLSRAVSAITGFFGFASHVGIAGCERPQLLPGHDLAQPPN
jgi:hypothetical protein